MGIKTYGELNSIDSIKDISEYSILIIKSRSKKDATGEIISLEKFIEDIISSEKFNNILQEKLPNKRINTVLRELINSEELTQLLKDKIKEVSNG